MCSCFCLGCTAAIFIGHVWASKTLRVKIVVCQIQIFSFFVSVLCCLCNLIPFLSCKLNDKIHNSSWQVLTISFQSKGLISKRIRSKSMFLDKLLRIIFHNQWYWYKARFKNLKSHYLDFLLPLSNTVQMPMVCRL